jgi:hypothetical protein
MPLSSTYYESLKTKADADAQAKKAAYDAALARATAVEFDEKGNIKTDSSGNPTYKTDASGTKLQGTLDVNYANQQRSTAAGGEAAGMLRSGQMARAKMDDLTTYRANLMGAMSAAQEGKTAVDTGLSRQLAEYKAQYGSETPGTSTSSKSSSSKPSTPSTPQTPNVTPAPVYGGNATVKPVTRKPGTVVMKPGRNIR